MQPFSTPWTTRSGDLKDRVKQVKATNTTHEPYSYVQIRTKLYAMSLGHAVIPPGPVAVGWPSLIGHEPEQSSSTMITLGVLL